MYFSLPLECCKNTQGRSCRDGTEARSLINYDHDEHKEQTRVIKVGAISLVLGWWRAECELK